jgi:hypothetical protein
VNYVAQIAAVLLAAAQEPAIPPHKDSITVIATADPRTVENPDPSQRILVRQELLDANPGRPGVPVSIPGLPAETASGGIKAPQYFAPGVAGDHGEPIAQFIQLGSYLVPNNLSANAHGNGYADPNILVPAVIESVSTDGGAFNVREGNHSVDLSAAYGLRSRFEPFAILTGDQRDVDLSLGWNWLALEAAYGNGFLDRLEHRRQFKVNAVRTFDLGRKHKLSLLAIGYYGTSMIPGLVPVGVPNLHDTIDARQRDQTHTGEIALNDVWSLTPATQIQFSAFFRTYNLSLYSNFGDGLIRQSEFRTETGGNSSYIHKFNRHVSLLSGMDYLREAPRRLDLDRYDPVFQPVTANNVTLNFVTPFVALDGDIKPWLHYNLGWRRDQIDFDNVALLNPAGSFHRWVGVNSPKGTLSLLPPARLWLPTLAFSYGQAFFTNDPRIQGTTPVSRAHAYQLVASRTISGTEVRVTLSHVTQEQSLAKIDADTGLQYNQGPSRNRSVTVSARRYFHGGMLQGSLSKADTQVPEAPRLIFDFLGTLDRLPWHLHARGEFEEVGQKPLGDGFVSTPVREFRGALTRSFHEGKLEAGVHFQIASGYSGQTTEMLGIERVVGVYIPSYASISFSYHFGRP